MAHIEFHNASLDIPIFNANSRSLKSRLMQLATDGTLRADESGHVVVQALQNLNFQWGDGDRIGLIGPNGSGKSSLLRMLSGVYAPTQGIAQIEGSVASLIDVSLGVNQEATGRENVFLRGALLGLSKAQMREKVHEIIEFSELGQFIDMPVRTYSSGMHMRLAFAVSTVIRPEILLMDEWLSVGDEHFRAKAEARMAELVNATKILVIASHSRDLILKTCNRVLWLEHGRIKMDGEPAEVCGGYFG